MERCKLLHLALMLAMSLLVSLESVQANLITNPGFETGSSFPDNWGSWTPGGSANWINDAGNAHGGSKYMELDVTAGGSLVMIYNRNIPASSGKTYTLSAYVKNAGGDGTGALKIEFYGGLNGSDPKGSNEWSFSVPADWQKVQFSTVSPAGTNYITAGIIKYGSETTSWIDDASLTEVSSEPDIVFDINNTLHTFDGFGAQIWDSTADNNLVLTELNIKYVRVSSTSAAINAQNYGAEVVYLIWSAPSAWLDGNKELLTQYVDDYADYWADRIDSAYAAGLLPEYIELSNEPDGNWNTYISPTNYNTLVKLVRAELDLRGFTDIGIVGPGLTHLDWANHNSTWISALDSTAVASLAGWSTHTWDDGDLCSGGGSCIENNWFDFGDSADAQDSTLPKFITEYATKENTFHGVEYRHPDQYKERNAANFMPYAARVYENTLALLNSGASVPFIWQATDQSWETKGWGLIDLSSTPKPVYYALQTLYPKIPVGSKVLSPPDQAFSSIYSGAFIDNGLLVMGLANDSDTEQSTNVLIQGADDLSIIEAPACIIDHVGDPLAVPYDYDTAQIVYRNLVVNPDNSIDVTLPADSTLTIVLCTLSQADIDDDCDVDIDDLIDFAVAWLSSDADADFNESGKADFVDFALLAEDWLTGTASP